MVSNCGDKGTRCPNRTGPENRSRKLLSSQTPFSHFFFFSLSLSLLSIYQLLHSLTFFPCFRPTVPYTLLLLLPPPSSSSSIDGPSLTWNETQGQVPLRYKTICSTLPDFFLIPPSPSPFFLRFHCWQRERKKKIGEIATWRKKRSSKSDSYFPEREKKKAKAVMSVNDILQLSLHSGELSFQLPPLSPIIAFMLFLLYHKPPPPPTPPTPRPWDAKVNYSLAVQVQLDDNYTTAGSRGGKPFLSAWACMELIRWFSSSFFFFFFLSSLSFFGEGKGAGRENTGGFSLFHSA